MHLHFEGQPPEILNAVKAVALEADQLAEYAGAYRSDELQVTYRFELENGELYARYWGVPKGPLKTGARDVFRLPEATLSFVRDGEGTITGFTASAGRVRDIRFIKE
jgi:hypothetical protein